MKIMMGISKTDSRKIAFAFDWLLFEVLATHVRVGENQVHVTIDLDHISPRVANSIFALIHEVFGLDCVIETKLEIFDSSDRGVILASPIECAQQLLGLVNVQ